MKTTCPYCGVGCGVEITGGVVAGDMSHPANFGKLCVKGSTLAQTLDDSGRLLHPLIGGMRSSWDGALGLVAERFGAVLREHGPGAVAFYGSGQFLTEDYYVANKLVKGFWGSANIETNSRLCMSSTVSGHMRAFGEDVVPGCYEDIDEADLLVFVGANAAWCHPVLFERALAARAARGTRIVVVDPRRTATAALADLHLAVRPDGDVGLFNYLLTVLSDRGCLDRDFVGAHTQGFVGALEAAREGVVTAEELGVGDEELEVFCAWFCRTERVVTLFSQGVNQSVTGTDKVNAIINCHLATGRIGRVGMGPLSLTGQPNAMGGREAGGFSNQLAAHLRFNSEDDRALLKEFWRCERLPATVGLKAVEMFEAVERGVIKAIWIAATNPAESLPRSKRVRAALEACPFVVVSDCWPTETARLADVVLPAAAWGEKDGTVTNSERVISRQRAFRPVVGEARPDWWMFVQVARRMGFGDGFGFETPAAIFREHAALSGFGNRGGRVFNIGGLAGVSDDAYDSMAPVRWPLGRRRLFGDGAFSTPDGRGRFVAVRAAGIEPRNISYPFTLNTGRLRDQWHTMTRTGFVPALMSSAGEANFVISAGDAARLAISEGDLVRLSTGHGSAILPAVVTDGQRAGEIFAAMHWTEAHSGAGTVNKLVGAARDAHSGQPAFKHECAALEVLPTYWHGVLHGRSGHVPAGQFYAARVPLAAGLHRVVLTGWKTLDFHAGFSDWAVRLCGGAADDERVEMIDPGRGSYRLGVFRDGVLVACLFIERQRAALPDYESLGALFEEPALPANRTAILRGAAGAVTARGRVVCVCHNVPETRILAAIASDNLRSVAAVGVACRAGTNCGSCKGEIAELLQRAADGAQALGVERPLVGAES